VSFEVASEKTARVQFSREGESPGGLVRLSIRPIEVKTRKTEMPRTRTIEAVVGLSQGLAQTEKRP